MKSIINEENIKTVLTISGIIIVIVLLVIYFDENRVQEVKIDNYSEDGNIAYHIDEFDWGENYANVKGWACFRGGNYEVVNTNIALRECDSDKVYIIPTQIEERTDITELFNDGYDYKNSGIVACINADSLDVDKKYEIIVLLKNNTGSYMVKTGEILINEKK